MSALRIGLVGAGPWARRVHAPVAARHPRYRFAGVWTRRPEAAAALCAEVGGRPFGSLDELVAASDVVAFAVPPAVQAGLVPVVVAAGRHVVLEKPLAADAAGARAVADAVVAAGVCSTTVLVLRFDPQVRAWLDAAPGAAAGPDTVGVARWLSGALLGGPYHRSAWRSELGALSDVGPHVVDLMDAALGPVTEVDLARHDEPDLWRFGLVHAGGACSTVTLSLRLPVDPTEIEFTVFGPDRRLAVGRGSTDAADRYARLLDELADAIADGRTALPTDVRRALALQEVLDDVRAQAGGPSG